MKKGLWGDLIVYFILPILLCSVSNPNVYVFSNLIVSMVGIAYTLFIRYSQYRFNISGIIFMSLYTLLQSFKVGATSAYIAYSYDTYYMVVVAIIFIVSPAFDKNIVKQFFIDILKALGYGVMQINNIIKKHNLNVNFERISIIICSHLLIWSVIRTHSIASFGQSGYKGNIDTEVLVNLLFLIVEILYIS
ncbi:MAG: hypothetical protein ACRCX2_31000, partial [Paraclostridium sp.]